MNLQKKTTKLNTFSDAFISTKKRSVLREALYKVYGISLYKLFNLSLRFRNFFEISQIENNTKKTEYITISVQAAKHVLS